MINATINLIVVDDHAGVRKRISKLLRSTTDIVVVGEAATGAQAIKLALSKKPDMMLLDVELPDQRGTTVMRRLRSILPDMKVLAISSYSDRQFVLGMKENGASGYLTKDKIPSQLIESIRGIIYKGFEWIGPLVKREDGSAAGFEQTLTKKEVEILKLLLIDQSEYSIASSIGMNERQVKRFLELLMKKYQVDSINDLKLIAQKKFLDPNE